MATSLRHPAWQIDYQTALREYGLDLFNISLQRAIAACMFYLNDLPSDSASYLGRLSCLAALSDLLVLRTLHYKYEFRRLANTSDSAA